MNLGRLDIAATLTVLWAQAVSGQTAAGTLLSATQAVAELPGAPSIVAAAGLTRTNERLLTLEEAGGVSDRAMRLVIVGGLDGTAESAEAVLEALHWFKTDAPAALRRAWSITALPCADPQRCSTVSPATGLAAGGAQVFPPEGGFYNHDASPESRYLWRWVAFQAPDLVLEVRSGQTLSWEVSQGAGPLRLDGPRPPSGTLAAAMSAGAPSGLAPVAAVRVSTSIDDAPRMLRSLLEAAMSLGRSPLHDALFARVSRTPVEIATVLAGRYPASPAVSYIPAVAWSNTLRLAARLGDAGLVENVRSQMAPFLSGEIATVTEPYRLTSLAGLFAFLDFSVPGRSDGALNVAITGAEFMFPLSTEAILRSPTGWTDDMFMVSSLLSRIGAHTGDARYGATVGRLLVDVSTSTGAGETKQYYLNRTAIFGADDRGGAMALWAAVEMDELRRQ